MKMNSIQGDPYDDAHATPFLFFSALLYSILNTNKSAHQIHAIDRRREREKKTQLHWILKKITKWTMKGSKFTGSFMGYVISDELASLLHQSFNPFSMFLNNFKRNLENEIKLLTSVHRIYVKCSVSNGIWIFEFFK